MILAARNCAKLAKKLANKMNQKLLPYEQNEFADGELYYRLKYHKRPNFLHLIGNVTADPASIFELLTLFKAAQDNGIAVKSLVVPYLAYARQDDVYKQGEPVMAELIAAMLDRVHAPRFYFLSLHSAKIRNHLAPHHEISGLQLLKGEIQSHKYDLIVAADDGAAKRARSFANEGQPVLVLPKERKDRTKVIRPVKDFAVDGKKTLIVDDLVSTGRTLMSAAKILKANNAKCVDVAVVHPVWAKPAKKLLISGDIRQIYTTDTLPAPHHRKVKVISVADEIADALKSVRYV